MKPVAGGRDEGRDETGEFLNLLPNSFSLSPLSIGSIFLLLNITQNDEYSSPK